MRKYIQFPAYPTGRPCLVDPNEIAAVTDAIETQAAKIVGGQPQLAIVGTVIYVQGSKIIVAAPLDMVVDAIAQAENAIPDGEKN